MPATISVRHRIRIGRLAEQQHPDNNTSGGADPGPHRIGRTKGSDFSATAINAKLRIMANTVAAVGQNRVSPPEYFRPGAQPISSTPAASNANHALTVVPIQTPASHVRVAVDDVF